jgi:hypothetical protein
MKYIVKEVPVGMTAREYSFEIGRYVLYNVVKWIISNAGCLFWPQKPAISGWDA